MRTRQVFPATNSAAATQERPLRPVWVPWAYSLIALLEGVEAPTNENLSSSGLGSDRYAAALASIPLELQERFIAAVVARAQRQDASEKR
jgi:hypothetical protein